MLHRLTLAGKLALCLVFVAPQSGNAQGFGPPTTGKLLYRQGLPIPVPGSSGLFYGQMPDGSVGMMPLQQFEAGQGTLFFLEGLPIPVPGSPGFFYAGRVGGSMGMMPLQNIVFDKQKLLYLQGLPIPVPGSPGYFYGGMPDGSVGMMPLQVR